MGRDNPASPCSPRQAIATEVAPTNRSSPPCQSPDCRSGFSRDNDPPCPPTPTPSVRGPMGRGNPASPCSPRQAIATEVAPTNRSSPPCQSPDCRSGFSRDNDPPCPPTPTPSARGPMGRDNPASPRSPRQAIATEVAPTTRSSPPCQSPDCRSGFSRDNDPP